MKKVVIAIMCFIMTGCMTTDLYMDYVGNPNYRVTVEQIDDLKNPGIFYESLIYKDWQGLPKGNEYVYLSKYEGNLGDEYFLTFEFRGSNWRFMDGSLLVETDGTLHEFVDDNPNRDTGQVVDLVYVVERVVVPLEETLVQELATAQSIRVQAYLNAITFSEEDKKRLREFYEQYVIKTTPAL